MDAYKQLGIYKDIVDHHIEDFFRQRIHDMRDVDPYASYMMKLLKEYTLRGGKRIRAAMMYYGYKLFSQKNIDEAIKASIAFELIQSYLLIHDDIIDQDEMRRNGPTMHRMFEEAHKKTYGSPGSGHFGASMAILAGDIANHLANLVILNAQMPVDRKLKAATELNRSVHRVIYGEALDVLSNFQDNVKEADILRIHNLKTASYTFEGPLLVGAILGGAPQEKLDILSDYALPLGQAFQIQDDIQDIFGDEKKLGKPPGSDLKEGKKTLLVMKALEKADKREMAALNKALGNPKLTKSMVEDVQAVMVTTGSLDYSRRLANRLIRESRAAIEKLNMPGDAQDFLVGIADYMLERNQK